MVNLTHANNGNRLDAIPLIVTCHPSIVLLFEIRVAGEAERAGRWARLDSGGSHVGPSAVKKRCDQAYSAVTPRGQVCIKVQRPAAYIPSKVCLTCLLALERKEKRERERERSGSKERSVGALGGSYMH